MRKLIALASTVAMLAAAPLSFAATVSPCTPPLPISVVLSTELPQTVASATINVHAAMHNGGTHAVSDVSLYVVVFDQATGQVAARFITPDKYTLLPKSDAQANFDWQVPAAIPDGGYVVRAFAIENTTTLADMFLRTAESPHGDVPLRIEGGVAAASIASTDVNGAADTATSGPITISKSSAAVHAKIQNGTDGPYIGTFTWHLYAPDAKPGDAALLTKEEAIELHPHTSTTATFTLSDTSRGGYLLEGELSDGKTSSYTETWLDSTGVFRNAACMPTKEFPVSGRELLIVAGIALIALLLGAGRILTHKKLI